MIISYQHYISYVYGKSQINKKQKNNETKKQILQQKHNIKPEKGTTNKKQRLLYVIKLLHKSF